MSVETEGLDVGEKVVVIRGGRLGQPILQKSNILEVVGRLY